MPFAKMFMSRILGGIKSLSASGTTLLSPRSFHVIIKPLPKSITETSTLNLNSVAINTVSPLSGTTGIQRLLLPVSSLINQVSGFKVKGHLKRRCKDCYFVVRQQRQYVICPTHPRHKQMSMKKREYKSWILTHATQSKVRPY